MHIYPKSLLSKAGAEAAGHAIAQDMAACKEQEHRARAAEFADRVAYYLGGANQDRRVIMHFTGIDYQLSTPRGEHLGFFANKTLAADFAARHDLLIERPQPCPQQAQGLGPS